MRSQNEALEDKRKVGYIVLDQTQIDKAQHAYFNCNNIGVININSMPQTHDIPESLFNEKGKRLYSFLRVIANPALEESMSSIEKTVQFMSQYAFISYEQILRLIVLSDSKNYNGKTLIFGVITLDLESALYSCLNRNGQANELYNI